MKTELLYKKLSAALQAQKNCLEHKNPTWHAIWSDRVEKIMRSAPSGSGFNTGTSLEYVQEPDTELRFCTEYNHMDEAGYYDGWTTHVVKVTPRFSGIDIKVTGKNKNDIKEYIGDVFYDWLTTELDEDYFPAKQKEN